MDILNHCANSPNLPWYVTAAIAFATTVYPMLRRKFPALPDIYTMLARLTGPATPTPLPVVVPVTPAGPSSPLKPLAPVDPPADERFPLLSLGLNLLLAKLGKPQVTAVTDAPADVFLSLAKEVASAIGAKVEQHTEAVKALTGAASVGLVPNLK